MFFEFIWTIAGLTAVNLILSLIIIFKIRKQEKFQTSEAHANLELINQSLNGLAQIAEKLAAVNQPSQEPQMRQNGPDQKDPAESKEQRARKMIRQGEDPRHISRQLGISKSEIELLIASEKLGHRAARRQEKVPA